jgi:hypothetical protein
VGLEPWVVIGGEEENVFQSSEGHTFPHASDGVDYVSAYDDTGGQLKTVSWLVQLGEKDPRYARYWFEYDVALKQIVLTAMVGWRNYT